MRAGLLSSSKLRLIIKLWSLSCLGVLGYHSNRIGWSVDSLWISEGCKRKEPSYDCDLSSCQESREPEDLPLLVWECLSSISLQLMGIIALLTFFFFCFENDLSTSLASNFLHFFLASLLPLPPSFFLLCLTDSRKMWYLTEDPPPFWSGPKPFSPHHWSHVSYGLGTLWPRVAYSSFFFIQFLSFFKKILTRGHAYWF